jgi:polysaccharide export outer membrane protein
MKSRTVRPPFALFVVLLVPAVAAAQAPASPSPQPSTTPIAQVPQLPAAPATAAPATTAPATGQKPATGQAAPQRQAQPQAAPGTANVPAGAVIPPGYVIGAEDILSIVFWRDKEMSADVGVRPDGKISLPLLNDVEAAGLTPEQLRERLTEAAGRLVEDPNVSVIVKIINSRKVFVTGQVGKPGPYPLSAPTTVLQLLATAGGVLEYAKLKDIRIMRTENGKPVSFKFNYKDVMEGKNLKQNIELKPGDTVIVP